MPFKADDFHPAQHHPRQCVSRSANPLGSCGEIKSKNSQSDYLDLIQNGQGTKWKMKIMRVEVQGRNYAHRTIESIFLTAPYVLCTSKSNILYPLLSLSRSIDLDLETEIRFDKKQEREGEQANWNTGTVYIMKTQYSFISHDLTKRFAWMCAMVNYKVAL